MDGSSSGGSAAQLAGAAAGSATAAAANAVDARAAAAASLVRITGAKIAFVSFANGAFSDFIENWVLSVQRLGVPFVVGALDEPMTAHAAQRGWPHLDLKAGVGGNSSFFRANFKTFRNMGATKVGLAGGCRTADGLPACFL